MNTQKKHAHPKKNKKTYTPKVLGEGGMGQVILEHQTVPERYIAVKKLLYPSIETQQYLLHEANITGQLEHPNIVPIYEIRNPNTMHIEVYMKYIKGRTLAQYMLCDDFTIQKGVRILIDICEALNHAHNHHIIHRDIKPENIMIGEHNEVYLLDWGIALNKNSPQQENTVVGTLGYMAPEMLLADPKHIDERTDIYLLGATIHELITKEVRHQATSKKHVRDVITASKKHLFTDKNNVFLSDLCNQCCAKNKEDRPQNIIQVKESLLYYLEHLRAIEICTKGESEGGLVSYFLEKNNTRLAENHFHRARFAFEQALMIIPNLPRALKGYKTVMNTWLTWNIQKQNLHETLKWREEPLFPHTIERVHTFIDEHQQKSKLFSRWQRIGRNYTQFENQNMHIFIVCTILITVYFVASSLTENYDIGTLHINDVQLLQESAVMMPPLLLATLWTHHYYPQNLRLQHLTTCFSGTTFLMLLHRLIAVRYGHESLSIINVDTCIVAFGFWMSHPAFRSGKNVGGFCCLMGITTLFQPHLFWYCNILCIVCIITAITMDIIYAIRSKEEGSVQDAKAG